MIDDILEHGFCEFSEPLIFNFGESVYLLGKCFNTQKDEKEIRECIRSKLWFTYRRNFPPIGGTGPTTDQGWGCMLRCGQMILAQAMIRIHLGPHWIYDPKNVDKTYRKILKIFQDKKECNFSIHQIAQMGVSEGKKIGEWFGPNTIAQVLKKLAVYDHLSRITVHIALDNVLFAEDAHTIARLCPHPSSPSEVADHNYNVEYDHKVVNKVTLDSNVNKSKYDFNSAEDHILSSNSMNCSYGDWRPLLLIIPLRLGLKSINQCYLPAIQAFFKLPQCMGILGGRPNHALYFIGISEDKLIYLDPHTCQPYVDFESSQTNSASFEDSSYHCPFVQSIPYENVDPSLAIAFLCVNKEEFEELSRLLREDLLIASTPPLFEFLDSRPKGFPKFVPYVGERAVIKDDYFDLGGIYDSFDDFEILE